MSDEQLALLALLGAGAVAGGFALSPEPLASPSVWYRLVWPRELDHKAVIALYRYLASDHRRHVLAIETVATHGQLTYHLGLAEQYREAALAALAAYLPGVAAELIEHESLPAPNYAWQLVISSKEHALHTEDTAEIVRALTTALSSTSSHGTVIMQWLLGPRLVPISAPTEIHASLLASWRDVLQQTPNRSTPLDPETRRSLKDKLEQAGFRAVCRFGLTSPNSEIAHSVAAQLLTALRLAETPNVHLKLRKENPDRLARARSPHSWPLALNVKELTALTAWPIDGDAYPGVSRLSARLIAADQAVASEGRIVAQATYPGKKRLLALRLSDSLQHLHILGPTGVGKSTLLLNLITQDIAAGRGVAVIDPKGDLVEEVLCRVPEARWNDIVVLDPADELRPVGFNVLRSVHGSAELIADQVLSVFHDLYRENWGPRTSDILHAALLTVAARPKMTLCALPVLLSNPGFRRHAVAQLSDDVALKPFWAWFDGLSDGERQQAIAPVMNKLRVFVLRPRLRAVIGQSEPGFDLESVFSERKVVLISLAKGLIGPEAAALLGSLAISQLWQTALGQVRVAAAKRSPVMVYIDEFQDYLHLPTDLADVLAQARGLGVGLTLAHQHLAQLPVTLRSAVMANARSRICFQLASEDAHLIARSSGQIEASDLQNLGRYEAYVSLVSHGNVTGFASARTLPASEPLSNAQTLRALSRNRYGRDLTSIEAELATLVRGAEANDERPIGRRRRP